MKKLFVLTVFMIIITSCTTLNKTVKNTPFGDTLGLNIYNSANIKSTDFDYFEDATLEFIEKYNTEGHKTHLYYSLIDSNSIVLNLVSNSYVTRENQAAGVIITSLGIATFLFTISNPELGFWLFFWYNPQNHSIINISISNDLNPSTKVFKREIKSGHRFRNPEIQKTFQKEAYYKFLESLLKNVLHEKKYEITDIFTDTIIKKNGTTIRCKITSQDDKWLYFNMKYKEDQIFKTRINNSKVNKIIYGDKMN